jgi:hypothetical protein
MNQFLDDVSKLFVILKDLDRHVCHSDIQLASRHLQSSQQTTLISSGGSRK